MDTDFSLIRKMKSGEENAFDTFVRKHYPDILKYCYYHGPEGSAEDLTQETFVRFFSSLSGYRHMGKARNYLYTIAANLCKDSYKKKTEVPVDIRMESEAVQDGLRKESRQENVEDPVEALSEQLLIEAALKKLPEEMREVIVLYYFQDMKLREIAAVLDISLPLVKYRMSRGKKQLETLLREEEGV